MSLFEQKIPSKTITVLGATGFLGHYVVAALAKKNYHIRVICRDLEKAMALKPYGNIGQIVPITCSLNDEQQLQHIIAGSDVVINMVGILYERKKNDFDTLHYHLARRLALIAADNHVQHYIHISGLGVDKAYETSRYAQSKLHGEKAVLEAHDNAIIIRPSVIYGKGDSFVSRLAPILRTIPIMPIFGLGNFKLQPVYVSDVTHMIVKLLELSPAQQKELSPQRIVNATGNHIYSFKDILNLIAEAINIKPRYIHIPMFFGHAMAVFAEIQPLLPPFITRDQLRLMAYDSIADTTYPNLSDFNISAQSLFNILPTYCDTWRLGGRFTTTRY